MNRKVNVLALFPGNNPHKEQINDEAQQKRHDDRSCILGKHGSIDREVLRNNALNPSYLIQLLDNRSECTREQTRSRTEHCHAHERLHDAIKNLMRLLALEQQAYKSYQA